MSNSGSLLSFMPSGGVLPGSSQRLSLAAEILREVRSCGAPSRLRAASRVDVATQLYEDGHWAEAFDAAAWDADAGDPRAAKLALLMLRYGASLYGVPLAAEPCRVARWAKLVIGAARLPKEQAPIRVHRVSRSTSRRTASPSSITAIA